MEENELSYKTLRRIQQLERTSPFLTKIDAKFYSKLTTYLKNFKSIVNQEDNPQKIKLFDDEIKNTEKLALSIYELREKKIVQGALSKVRGGKPDVKNILEREKKLYESLIEHLILTRKQLLEDKAPEPSTGQIKNLEKKEKKTNNNPLVRILKDIPEFVGPDMKTYVLRKDDVLTVSKQMSETFIKRGVAQQIK